MTVWVIYSWGLMERIDRSGGHHLWNIGKEYSEFPFMISCSSFMQICCRHLPESDYNCAKLKDQRNGILKDWSGLWQKSPTVVRGAQSLWQNPSETHPETPKTHLYMSVSILNVEGDECVKSLKCNTLIKWYYPWLSNCIHLVIFQIRKYKQLFSRIYVFYHWLNYLVLTIHPVMYGWNSIKTADIQANVCKNCTRVLKVTKLLLRTSSCFSKNIPNLKIAGIFQQADIIKQSPN